MQTSKHFFCVGILMNADPDLDFVLIARPGQDPGSHKNGSVIFFGLICVYIVVPTPGGYLQSPVLRSRSRGAEIKLPPGAGPEITNCGSGCGSGSSSGSFLFTTDLKKNIEKIIVSEEVLLNCYNFNPITSFKKGYFQVIL
jgi:hypothetical protein